MKTVEQNTDSKLVNKVMENVLRPSTVVGGILACAIACASLLF